MTSCLLKFPCLLSLRNSGAKYVDNKSQGDFRILSLPRQYIGKKTAEDSVETFAYYVTNGLGILQHFAKGSDLGFNSWDYLFHRRTHYPMLEKIGTKNLAVCENQRKQHKLRVVKKKKSREGMVQKIQKIDW